MAENENMKLWDQVCTTDPAITKRVNQRGGFTAIDAQAQIKRATELWGPYGKTWGLDEVSYGYVQAPDGLPVEIWIEATFKYPGGAFFISGDMRYKAGDDCRKKLMTDVTTKALSKLGFNSDVFEGKFDDNKYVQQRKETSAQAAERILNPPDPDAELLVKKRGELLNFVENNSEYLETKVVGAIKRDIGKLSLKRIEEVYKGVADAVADLKQAKEQQEIF